MYKRFSLDSRVLLIIALWIIMLFMVTSCKEESRSYKEQRVEVDSVTFTFESPVDYDSQDFHMPENNIYIVFARSSPEGDHNEILLHVDTIEPWPERPNAKSLLEFDLELDRNRSDFRLLERSSTMVGTIRAEQVVFSYSTSAFELNLAVVERRTYFDHGGLIYNLWVSTDQRVADTANADFEHLLKTFKFLD